MRTVGVMVFALALCMMTGPLLVPAEASSLCTVSVKILVDQKEPMVQRVWENRYRERIAAASAVFEQCCHVQFRVVAVGTWTSDNTATDLLKLMDDFERKVKPTPAQLAIGFTGQYQTLQADSHIGGARGPFRPHILIREWGRQITEPERLEILVHELGHYLGAVHSPEHQSVMRPDVSDRQSRAKDFRIRFDSRNAAVMSLISDELSKLALVHLGQLPLATKERLRPIYKSLADALPNDPAAPRYLAMLGQSLGLAGESTDSLKDAVAGARTIVQAVTAAAARNKRLPKKGPGEIQLGGDRLTELYVRRAAAAAQRLPQSASTSSFLLGLGVALDDSSLLPSNPVVGNLWQKIESSSARLARVESLGAPTMRGRRDLAQHFAVSAALTILVGPQNAEHVGILKELQDARGGSGFSFADLSADLAGVQFANAVADGRVSLSRIERRFAVSDFVPDVAGLREGIAWKDFVKQYGSPPDARLQQERESLRARALALPGHKETAKPTTVGK